MKTSILLTIFISTFFCSCGQHKPDAINNVVNFDTLINHFKEYSYKNDTIKLPLIYKNNNYKIVLSDNPIFVNLDDTVLKNPFGNKYPLSYSVIFHDNLVALFEPGNFACYKLPSLERNIKLERKLNTKKFQYHWIFGNKLIGQYNNENYFFNTDFDWEPYHDVIPLKKQPKLFEDDKYIIFTDCHGEWGGTVYFYNKSTQIIYFTEATCANTIINRDKKYFVLSDLGHMSGNSDLKEIDNPEKLPTVNENRINKTYKGQALGYTDSSRQTKSIFDFYSIQIFSSFPCLGKTFYLTNWRERTFLAEIRDSTLSIVNPLFNDDLYTHRPMTTTYDKSTLINLDFYGIAGEREVSVLIIDGNKVTRIDWNEKHNR